MQWRQSFYDCWSAFGVLRIVQGGTGSGKGRVLLWAEQGGVAREENLQGALERRSPPALCHAVPPGLAQGESSGPAQSHSCLQSSGTAAEATTAGCSEASHMLGDCSLLVSILCQSYSFLHCAELLFHTQSLSLPYLLQL